MSSTSIRVFIRDDLTGKWEFLPIESGGNTLGFETDLELFWGAPILVSLNLMTLHSISKTENWPIEIEGSDLDKLEQEIQVAVVNRQLILENTDYKDIWYIDLFLRNINHAVKQAKEVNGGVVIW
ncbi:MAG: hypothetical protein K8I30_04755 [Anaerolineae bacterium]|nr:hypothetical protein [Anaerolineae bacterium]